MINAFSRNSPASRLPGRALLVLAAVLAVLQAFRAPLTAEPPPSDAEIKAVYIYNFLQLVTWPRREQGPSSGPFKICTVADGVTAGMIRALAGRKAAGRDIEVSSVTVNGPLEGCHIVYLALAAENRIDDILKRLEGTDSLTVSSIPGFARKGGVLGFVTEKKKVKVEMNLGAAKKTGLNFSAKLMEVARLIK